MITLYTLISKVKPKFSKLRTFTGEKSQKEFFGEHTFPARIFFISIDPQNYVQLENTQ